MVKVTAKMVVKENEFDALKNIIKNLVEDTRKEDGCICYELFQDINNKQIFTFIEEWESEEALNKHMESKHLLEARPKLKELQETKMEVNIYKLVI